MDMKKIWKLMAAIAIIGGLAACKKDKGPDVPEEPTDFSGGCEAVDLGLSVKWASYNVGAQYVGDHGYYFAWGETKNKDSFDASKEGDYKWGVWTYDAKPKYGMTKYTSNVEGGDGLKELQPGDDAATANWGTKWRTPTVKEFDELIDKSKCQWTWDDVRKGYTVMGLATGNSIFLPTPGYRHNGSKLDNVGEYGYYWASSVDELNPWGAHGLDINMHYQSNNGKTSRWYGQSVRAVTEY